MRNLAAIPAPTICGHLDGACLRDEDGMLIETFPTLAEAEDGFLAACVASVMLAEIFNGGTQ